MYTIVFPEVYLIFAWMSKSESFCCCRFSFWFCEKWNSHTCLLSMPWQHSTGQVDCFQLECYVKLRRRQRVFAFARPCLLDRVVRGLLLGKPGKPTGLMKTLKKGWKFSFAKFWRKLANDNLTNHNSHGTTVQLCRGFENNRTPKLNTIAQRCKVVSVSGSQQRVPETKRWHRCWFVSPLLSKCEYDL